METDTATLTEANKAVVRAVVERALGGHEPSALNDLYAPDYVYRNPPPGIAPDREGAMQWFAIVQAGFPDLTATVEEQIAEGDRVATRFTVRGTQTGDFLGIPPTGRAVTVTGILFERVERGRTAESWVQFDQLGMLQQLGVVGA